MMRGWSAVVLVVALTVALLLVAAHPLLGMFVAKFSASGPQRRTGHKVIKVTPVSFSDFVARFSPGWTHFQGHHHKQESREQAIIAAQITTRSPRVSSKKSYHSDDHPVGNDHHNGNNHDDDGDNSDYPSYKSKDGSSRSKVFNNNHRPKSVTETPNQRYHTTHLPDYEPFVPTQFTDHNLNHDHDNRFIQTTSAPHYMSDNYDPVYVTKKKKELRLQKQKQKEHRARKPPQQHRGAKQPQQTQLKFDDNEYYTQDTSAEKFDDLYQKSQEASAGVSVNKKPRRVNEVIRTTTPEPYYGSYDQELAGHSFDNNNDGDENNNYDYSNNKRENGQQGPIRSFKAALRRKPVSTKEPPQEEYYQDALQASEQTVPLVNKLLAEHLPSSSISSSFNQDGDLAVSESPLVANHTVKHVSPDKSEQDIIDSQDTIPPESQVKAVDDNLIREVSSLPPDSITVSAGHDILRILPAMTTTVEPKPRVIGDHFDDLPTSGLSTSSDNIGERPATEKSTTQIEWPQLRGSNNKLNDVDLYDDNSIDDEDHYGHETTSSIKPDTNYVGQARDQSTNGHQDPFPSTVSTTTTTTTRNTTITTTKDSLNQEDNGRENSQIKSENNHVKGGKTQDESGSSSSQGNDIHPGDAYDGHGNEEDDSSKDKKTTNRPPVVMLPRSKPGMLVIGEQTAASEGSVSSGDSGDISDHKGSEEEKGSEENEVWPHQYNIEVRKRYKFKPTRGPVHWDAEPDKEGKHVHEGRDQLIDKELEESRYRLLEHKEEEHWHQRKWHKEGLKEEYLDGKPANLGDNSVTTSVEMQPSASNSESVEEKAAREKSPLPAWGRPLAPGSSKKEQEAHFTIPTPGFRVNKKFVKWVQNEVGSIPII